MVNACLVRHGECSRGLSGDLGGAARQQHPFGSPDVAKCSSLDQLHDHEVSVFVVAEVVDADDVRMVQPGGVLSLTAEAGYERIISGELRVENLDGDAAAQGDVFRREDVSHTSAGEVPGNSISALKHALFSHDGEW